MKHENCPNCGSPVVLFANYEKNDEDALGLHCRRCGWKETMGDLYRQLAGRDVVQITSELLNDGKGLVRVGVPKDWSFKRLMMACEYLLWVTAARSPAGFEKALELLCRGATTYHNAEQTSGGHG
jgi:ribosomal protein S27AE